MKSNSCKTESSEQRFQLMPMREDTVYNLIPTKLEGLNKHLKLSNEKLERPCMKNKSQDSVQHQNVVALMDARSDSMKSQLSARKLISGR